MLFSLIVFLSLFCCGNGRYTAFLTNVESNPNKTSPLSGNILLSKAERDLVFQKAF